MRQGKNEYYLDVVDKLSQAKGLKANLEFKLEQASLRVAHYCESIFALKKQITELERVVQRIQDDKLNKAPTMGRIHALAKRLGL